jgi:CubicO group peptidase (beta-lactamase class C family)
VEVFVHCVIGLVCVLALGVMPLVGCSDSEGAGASAGDGGSGGAGGVGGTTTAELEEFLDDYIDQQVKIDDTGIAVALVRADGRVELERTYGMANIEESVRMSPDTVSYLASVAKQFTATAIMLLYEDGLVDPEDLVTQTFPEVPPEWAGMTVHHLLTHQSGLASYVPPDGATNDDMLAHVIETPLSFPPGSEFEYSNPGYTLLAMLVERVTGEPFPDFVRERVFVPLGMSDTLVPTVSPPDVPNLARGYLLGEPQAYPSLLYGQGGQYSTLTDMVRWELGLRSATILSRDTLALMFTPHVEIPEDRQVAPHYDDCDYGYGWFICDSKVGSLQHHGGRGYGFRTAVDRHPSEGLTTIMLSNGSYEWTYEIGASLMEFYLDDGDIGAFEVEP